MNQDNNILIYQDKDGTTRVSVLFSDEDIWLTQDQIAELYNTTQQNISQHIAGIISAGELDKEATHKKFLLVRTEGSRHRTVPSLTIAACAQPYIPTWATTRGRPQYTFAHFLV